MQPALRHSDTIARLARGAFWYALALLFIYGGLWRTPVASIPVNDFDEPQWLSHSVCADSLFSSRYHEICRGLNNQTLDHSAGAKYLIFLARAVAGIPAEAVKRLYIHTEPVAPDIRSAVVRFMTMLSSLALLVLFAGLRRVYGSTAALSCIVLFTITAVWQEFLRTVMAEAPLFFFTVLTWASSIWIIHLLTRKPTAPFGWLALAAVALGLSLGMAVGVKPNAALLAVSVVAMLLPFGRRLTREWQTLLWLGTIVALSALLALWFTYPLLWEGDLFMRIEEALIFRTSLVTRQTIVFASSFLADPAQSIRAGLSNAFSADYYNVFPSWLGVPLALVGLWTGFTRGRRLAPSSHAWLLGVGLANLPLVPLNGNRYWIFLLFAVMIFSGIGIGQLAEAALRRTNPLASVASPADELPTRHYSRPAQIAGAICVVTAVACIAVIGVAVLRSGEPRRLYQAYTAANARQQVRAEIQAFSQIIAYEARRGVWSEPSVLDEAQLLFEREIDSTDPGVIQAVNELGQLLLAYSPNDDLKARVRYELDGVHTRMIGQAMITVGQLKTNVPAEWGSVEAAAITLFTPDQTIDTSLEVRETGDYAINVTGMNLAPAPIEIGVFIDGANAGILSYDRGDNSWTEQSLTARITAGRHTVQLKLLNDSIVQGVDRNAAVRGLTVTPPGSNATPHFVCLSDGAAADTVQGKLCASGDPALVLDSEHREALITVSVALPAFYDIELRATADGADQQILAGLDDLPVGMMQLKPGEQTLQLSPLYLLPGEHTLRLSSTGSQAATSNVTVKQLTLSPRYPRARTFTPMRAGSSDPQALALNTDTTVYVEWTGYGSGYSFYQIYVYGRASDQAAAQIQLSVDKNPVGSITLDSYGTYPAPLLVELANGAAHTIELRPTTTGQAAKIYGIDIVTESDPLIFAGGDMRWDRTNNAVVDARESGVIVPPEIKLARPVTIGQAGLYNITVRVRAPQGGSCKLRISVSDLLIGEESIGTNGGWEEHSARVYLPTGQHDIGLSWSGEVGAEPVEIIYVQLEPIR